MRQYDDSIELIDEKEVCKLIAVCVLSIAWLITVLQSRFAEILSAERRRKKRLNVALITVHDSLGSLDY